MVARDAFSIRDAKHHIENLTAPVSFLFKLTRRKNKMAKQKMLKTNCVGCGKEIEVPAYILETAQAACGEGCAYAVMYL